MSNPFGNQGANPFDANPYGQPVGGGPGAYSYDVQTTYMPETSVPAVGPPPGSFHAAPAHPPAVYATGTVPAVPQAVPVASGQPQQGGPKLNFMSSTALPTASGNIGSGPRGAHPQGTGEFSAAPGSASVPVAGGGGGGGPQGARDTQPLLRAGGGERPQEDYSKYAFYNPRKYRPYFDVDTTEVLWRVGSSFIGAFRANFMATTQERPDLYGPFWITTTLIFVTAVAGNYANYIEWWRKEHDGSTPSPSPSPAPDASGAPAPSSSAPADQWYTDYAKLGESAAMFYGYTFLGSFLLWLGMRYLRAELRLVNMFCIYGYAMTIFIPISLVCILPLDSVRWGVVMGGTGISALFLLMNLKERIMPAGPGKAIPMLIIVLALHVLVGLLLKVFFFSY